MIKKWTKGAGEFINRMMHGSDGGGGSGGGNIGMSGGDDSYNRIRLELEIEENVVGPHSTAVFDSDTERTPVLVLVYLYFIVVASVLGTGILAIPVKLAESGFDPFLASYTLCYVMQVLSTFFLIEILQRVYSIIRINSNQEIKSKFEQCVTDNNNHNRIFKNGGGSSIGIVIGDDENDELELQDMSKESSTVIGHHHHHSLSSPHGDGSTSPPSAAAGTTSNATTPITRKRTSTPPLGGGGEEEGEGMEEEEVVPLNQWTIPASGTVPSSPIQTSSSAASLETEATPNLHYLGSKFLGKYSHTVFIFSVILHFTSVLISYGLAGSEAYGQLFKVDHSYLIVPVIIIFTCIIIFGSEALQHIITLFTFGKGTLLVVIVFITGIISNSVEHEISNNWFDIGKSFLISTVALGGSVSVLPIVFPKLVFSKKEMKKCYLTVFSSLTTVYILNIIWCWFLLRIIPQLPDPNNPSYPSLLEAEKKGQIATIPLMGVVEQFYPEFLWIARITDIFIVISISISFITVGTGFKHTLDGFSHSWRKSSLQKSSTNKKHQHQQKQSLLSMSSSVEHSSVSDNMSDNNNNIILGHSQTQEMEDIDLGSSQQQQMVDHPKLLGLVYKTKSKLSDLFNTLNQKIDSRENRNNQQHPNLHNSSGSGHSPIDQLDESETSGEIRMKEETTTMATTTKQHINIREYTLYIVGFGFILLVAILNPRGFLMVMENGTSLGLNLQAGLFVVMMLNFSRSHYHHYPIPLPIPQRVYQARYIVFVYFTFAVFYDFYLILKHLIA
ncbi:hypothetical protein DFA_04518 [Cavenderia fasciculata]|uniref:Uncharacterized protein n=1 Tax=Cavenderia fasciculata TaxID=261658 RepID=F4PPT6_CACFS|nr:uncharacterized protein DFA_04518 [Cavenderia fasciculata]EGG22399.1 hypothetical protein DFA_04518 [Cavenderia fasciculata]|eukprot:XP_004360250.1 hypothetical protein DFA_04518 [Cavenderia fasciculata]